MNRTHVVVTGANGFIGQHLCRKLVESGRDVTACIREQANIPDLDCNSAALQVCRIPSLGRSTALSRILRNADAVIHLAGRAHVMRETAKDPLRAFRDVNVRVTENLASLAIESGVKRFIYLSSVKVNGEVTNDNAFCADDPPGYCDPYGQSKWEAEERLIELAAGTMMEWVIVRPPLVYGPDVRGNFLAIMKYLFRRALLPLGSIHNNRSLVSVYNLNDFLCLSVDHPTTANNRFLISDSEDISTPDLIRRIALAMDRSPRLIRCPEVILLIAGAMLGQKEAVQRLCSSLVLDKQKVHRVTGWRAPITLDLGLNRTVEWFLNQQRTMKDD